MADILCLSFCSGKLTDIPWANTSIYKQWNHQQSQLNLTLPPHRELLERCHRLTDGYFAMQDGGTLAASNGAVRVLRLTNTNTSTITTSVCRICGGHTNTCVLCSSCNHYGLKFPKKKSTIIQSATPRNSGPPEILQLWSKDENNKLISWNVNEMEICLHIAIIAL
jgi:hypothetical protein